MRAFGAALEGTQIVKVHSDYALSAPRDLPPTPLRKRLLSDNAPVSEGPVNHI